MSTKATQDGGFEPKRGRPDPARVATIGEEFAEVIGLESAPILARFFAGEPKSQTLEEFTVDGLGSEGVATLHGAGSEEILDGAVVERAHACGEVGSDPVRRRQASR